MSTTNVFKTALAKKGAAIMLISNLPQLMKKLNGKSIAEIGDGSNLKPSDLKFAQKELDNGNVIVNLLVTGLQKDTIVAFPFSRKLSKQYLEDSLTGEELLDCVCRINNVPTFEKDADGALVATGETHEGMNIGKPANLSFDEDGIVEVGFSADEEPATNPEPALGE